MSAAPLDHFNACTREELQRAHDILHAIITGEAGLPLLPATQGALHVAHDVVSWVLGFECGEAFRKVLNVAVECLKEKDVTVWRNHPPA